MTRRQSGFAIVLALGVVALAAVAASAVIAIESGWVRRSQLQTDMAQAQVLAHAGVDWTRALLYEDGRASAIDHAGEAWAARPAPLDVGNSRLSGHIEDQQALFNLNNLVQAGQAVPEQLTRLRRLLATLELPPDLVEALADWLDADADTRARGGAEDDYYQTLAVPYLAANQALADVGELALVRGFDANVRERLRPFVTVLPTATQVNVNTAPAEVLVALVDDLRLDEARSLVAARASAPFGTPVDFLKRLPRGLAVEAAAVSVGSGYFLVRLRATIADVEARATALLARTPTGWPAVLWRRAT